MATNCRARFPAVGGRLVLFLADSALAAQKTAFAYECLEPSLAVYDKVYKNMGVGDGIFSWWSRARRNGGK